MTRISTFLGALVALMLFLAPSMAFADDWMVTKLRGTVLQVVDNAWQPLGRGDVVSDTRVLRTMSTGRADLQRGKEVISLGPNTQVSIHDRTGQQFTTVQQYFGKVEVEAEVKNVQHFEVQTPFLAAVVKGTHFIVTSGKSSATVQVQRGKVQVTDEHTGARTYVTLGQKVTVSNGGSLKLEGKGVLSEITDKTGNVISAATSSSGGTSITVGSAVGVTVGSNTSVNVGGVAGVSVDTSGGGANVGVTVPGVADTTVGVSGGGVDVNANVGGISLGLSLGGSGGSGGGGSSGSGGSGSSGSSGSGGSGGSGSSGSSGSGGGGLLGLHIGL